MVKAKALVEEYQAMHVKIRALIDIKFPQHQKYPTHRIIVKVPSIIVETNEDRLSIDNPLLMDRMFKEDPVME